jgi:dihydroorotase-like cyclic amidohydrolase
VLDAGGLVCAPGFVDLHVHFREPGQEEKETVATGSRAAAAGGFTTVVTMPNTDPAIDNAGMVRYVIDRGARRACAACCPPARSASAAAARPWPSSAPWSRPAPWASPTTAPRSPTAS